jgi:hypothetical protein
MAVLWVVAPCRLVWVCRRFRCAWCLHHGGDEWRVSVCVKKRLTCRRGAVATIASCFLHPLTCHSWLCFRHNFFLVLITPAKRYRKLPIHSHSERKITLHVCLSSVATPASHSWGPGSNLCPQSGYTQVLIGFLSLSRQMLSLGHDHFFNVFLNLLFVNHPNILCCNRRASRRR